MKFFAPDTNFFLQCQDYLTLDWSSLAEEKEIYIVVPRTVLRELDKNIRAVTVHDEPIAPGESYPSWIRCSKLRAVV
jgi:hypothetical protein